MLNATTTPSSPDLAPSYRPRRGARVGKIGLVVLVALALVGGAAYLWLSMTAEVGAVGEEDCSAVTVSAPESASAESTRAAHEGICATFDALAASWAEHDAEAYGEQFTKEATYTTFAGTHYTGRQDIIDSHRALYNGPLEGTRLADSFLGFDLVRDDVAVVSTRGDTYEGEEPDDLSKVQTYTLAHEDDGQWRVTSFHNTKRNAVMERVQFLMEPESKPAAEQ